MNCNNVYTTNRRFPRPVAPPPHALSRAWLTAFFICLSLCGFSQGEASNWYFGYGAGLDFSKGEPVVTRGEINQWEGAASISDGDGKLLFYTNGRLVWNRDHKLMPKGRGLKGHNSSTQSSIIVPDPGNGNLFYLFTVTMGAGADGLQYSVVDMRANDGLGDVVRVNIPLITPVCEKVTAVRHANNRDVWVIAHGYNSDAYYAFLITEDSVSSAPVVSNTGNTIRGQHNTIGYLKSSPDGSKIAAAHLGLFVELSDFDIGTGRIGNPLKIPVESRSMSYGIEFSKSGEFLYVSETNRLNGTGDYRIFQYRVSADTDSLTASRQTVAKGDVGGAAGALQLGPDNRIYIAFNKKSYLGCILYPDKPGDQCGFDREHILLPKNVKSGLGLPSFIQSYFVNAGSSSGYLKSALGFLLILALLLVLFVIWRRRKKKKLKSPPPA